MPLNDLEKLKNEFESNDYPITSKKMIIPCRFVSKGKRNFLDLWNGKTAGICYCKSVWIFFKDSNHPLYSWLQEGHIASSGTIHNKFYDFNKVRLLLGFLKKDYLKHNIVHVKKSRPKKLNVKPEIVSKVVKQKRTDSGLFNSDTTNYIYLVVGGVRTTESSTAKQVGGLWANVGMTLNGRLPEDRIKDRDYQTKKTGNWKVIEKWDVGNATDHLVHRFLKKRNDVEWNSASANSEEFLFKDDDGTGEKAAQIIEDILLENLELPNFVLEKIEELEGRIEKLQNKILKDMGVL